MPIIKTNVTKTEALASVKEITQADKVSGKGKKNGTGGFTSKIFSHNIKEDEL